jgi:hypothetical protein
MKKEMIVKNNGFRQAPFALALFFLGMTLVGIYFKEPGRVMHQAWQICLSCVGIG